MMNLLQKIKMGDLFLYETRNGVKISDNGLFYVCTEDYP